MENHTSKTYSQRMNQTAASKFDVIKPYLEKDQKLLDFGSGVTPDFIKNVKNRAPLIMLMTFHQTLTLS